MMVVPSGTVTQGDGAPSRAQLGTVEATVESNSVVGMSMRRRSSIGGYLEFRPQLRAVFRTDEDRS